MCCECVVSFDIVSGALSDILNKLQKLHIFKRSSLPGNCVVDQNNLCI